MKNIHLFNMVEIVLAIGIVSLGVTGVVAMLPPALNSSRDAVAETTASEIASKVIECLKISASTAGELPATSGLTESVMTTIDSKFCATSESGYQVGYDSGGINAIVKIEDNSYSPGDGTCPIYYNDRQFSANTNALKSYRITVKWPATAADANRQSRVYITEIFRK